MHQNKSMNEGDQASASSSDGDVSNAEDDDEAEEQSEHTELGRGEGEGGRGDSANRACTENSDEAANGVSGAEGICFDQNIAISSNSMKFGPIYSVITGYGSKHHVGSSQTLEKPNSEGDPSEFVARGGRQSVPKDHLEECQ